MFPEGAIVAPGPLRFVRDSDWAPPPQRASVLGGAVSHLLRWVTALLPARSTATGPVVEALYYNLDLAAYSPVANAFWEVEYCDYGDLQGCEEKTRSGVTDASGKFTPGCPDEWESRFVGNVLAEGYDVLVLPSSAGGIDIDHEDCNVATEQVIAPASDRPHVYLNIDRDFGRAESRFGRSRPKMKVGLASYPDDPTSHYHPCCDSVSILSDPSNPTNKTRDHVWGQWGLNVQAHEFGHAYHWKAIEAPNVPPDADCSLHDFDVDISLYCGFTEGFAVFFAAWIAGPELDGSLEPLGSDDQVEANPWKGGPQDGAQTDGTVAAFFYDLVDSASDPDGSLGTDDDGVSCPGSFIADVVSTTSLSWPSASKLDGVDQFVYGAEGDLSAESVGSTHSPSWRTFWESVSVNAPAPAACTDSVRALWLRNLFDQ